MNGMNGYTRVDGRLMWMGKSATWPLGAEPRTCPACGLAWPREDDDPDTDYCASHRKSA
jgi:hypothetical protein